VIRVGILGCGKVADKHASQIRRVHDSMIVGVCDREALMAEQLSERLGIGHFFDNVESLLRECRPDVVHITTPPQSHFALAKQCLEAGCHVYVEKPFTMSSGEASELIRTAEGSGLKLTVGHETQFMPVALDMRRLIRAGYLGGAPVHMESVYCYQFSDEKYAKAVLGDKNHWVRQLPGGLLQNIISHGIGKIAEFLQEEDVTVLSHAFTSRLLEDMGETGIVDELRVIISSPRRTTAYFTFSSQMSPMAHQFRVYGPKNSLVADYNHQTLIRIPRHYTSYLNQFIPPFTEGRQYIAGGVNNIRKFLKRDFHSEAGIYNLISSFYRSIREDSPLPIPYPDILLTSRIMEEIFRQIECSAQGKSKGPNELSLKKEALRDE
jgi:predicted dehydrogenase